jgi:hypothetical protein
MAAGLQPSQAGINQAAGGLATSLRDIFQQIENLQAWLATEGQAGLVTLGFTAQDAATIISTFGNLQTLANVWNGTAAPAEFNYLANTQALWGGQ